MAICKRLLRYVVLFSLTVILTDWVADACFLYFYHPSPAIDARPGRFHLAAAVAKSPTEEHAVLGVSVSTSSPIDRITANKRAGEYLRNLVLFRGGRGMHSTPAFARFFDWIQVGRSWKQHLLKEWFRNRTGVIYDDTDQVVGFRRMEYQGVPLVAQGCAVCHVGRVLGKVVPGLGNKNIDPYALATTGPPRWLTRILESCEAAEPTSTALAKSASQFHKRVTDARRANLSQGLVSVATIWAWFYEQLGEPAPVDIPRAACKVPALWGYGEKRERGQFCDGVGDGTSPGWIAMVELVGGQTPKVVRQYSGELEAAESHFEKLLPPAYPLIIDVDLAARGKVAFSRNCRECHGDYEKDHNYLPLFQSPIHVPIDIVGTDRDRLKSVTPEFKQAVRRNPLVEMIRIVRTYEPGYFAPRLEGIWARFPYLHNGSVPSIADLLTPAEERPAAFDLRDAGEVYRFDPERLGLTVPTRGTADAKRLQQLGAAGRRHVFFVDREGHSNGGHEFGTTLSADEKRALIEYLKTL